MHDIVENGNKQQILLFILLIHDSNLSFYIYLTLPLQGEERTNLRRKEIEGEERKNLLFGK